MSETPPTIELSAPTHPPSIKREIEEVLTMTNQEIIDRANPNDPLAKGAMSSECMIHIIRRDLNTPTQLLATPLTATLMKRIEINLARSVTGFSEPTLGQVREEIIDRFIVALLQPKSDPDWFEVRFNRSFKFLRIDVCRQYIRKLKEMPIQNSWETEDGPINPVELVPSPMDQEEIVFLKQALSHLDDDERKILILHRELGIPLNSKEPGAQTLVGMLGVSERTIRNRLRSAEAKIIALKEKGS